MVLVVALVSGCNEEQPSPPPGQAARPQDITPAQPPKSATAPGPTTMQAPPEAKPVDLGACVLQATGAITVQETMQGGRAAVASRYWQTEEERGLAPVQDITVNCLGKQLRVSVVSKPGATVPFGPKTYRLDKGRGELVVLAKAGKPMTDVTGSIDITAFDTRHLAGTIDLSGKAGGSVKLTGSFDFACPGYGGCARN